MNYFLLNFQSPSIKQNPTVDISKYPTANNKVRTRIFPSPWSYRKRRKTTKTNYNYADWREGLRSTTERIGQSVSPQWAFLCSTPMPMGLPPRTFVH